MKVYSLTAARGEPRFCQAQQVEYWFWERGYEVVSFTREELHAGRLDEDLRHAPERTIVYGAVAIIREALARAGRPQPANIDFPNELQSFHGRRIEEATLGDVRRWLETRDSRLPGHVKPSLRQKLFKGRVVSGFSDLYSFSGAADDEPVWVQEVVEFASEWRATILRDRVVNVSHYLGDPLLFPDAQIIQRGLETFRNRPIACGIDWGVTRDGRTLLVEVNDGFALGNYGVPGHLYTAVIECRWRQLMGLDDNGVGWEP